MKKYLSYIVALTIILIGLKFLPYFRATPGLQSPGAGIRPFGSGY